MKRYLDDIILRTSKTAERCLDVFKTGSYGAELVHFNVMPKCLINLIQRIKFKGRFFVIYSFK